MGKTLQVIGDRAYDDTRSYHPGELADGRFADLTNPPSLAALKLHEVLFKAAGAAVADDRWHQIDLATLRAVDGMKHYDRRGLVGLFKELRGVVMEYDTDKETVIAGLLDVAKVEFEDGDGPTVVRWKFGEGFREIVAQSDYWAIIDRSATLSMTSRYALRLHELVALRVNLERKASEVFKLDDLRARLGVPAGKLVAWGSLAQKALQPAIAEVNQLSRFSVAMRPQKRGRSVVAVELSWEEKSDLAATRSELGRHSAGRTARRAGTVETVVETPQEAVESRKGAREGKSPSKPSKALHEAPRPVLTVDEFPASGGIHFTAWAEVAHAELPGGRNKPDIDMVAARFRQWAAEKGIPLKGPQILPAFEGFCRKWKIRD
ncbi:replication initiation protein [Brucella oryzae]|uniref:Replication initiation protein n=1 Tax=Brucella oryzae TaxID=335286 RepID=A0A2S7IUY6_9HYPH|nr:replication initiation protein [Brucella oryzae]PQA71768.1 replication initiation protein [Brucella oryzae]